MADIGSGIVEGLGRERAPPPVGPLKPFALRDVYPQQVFNKGSQTKPGRTGKAGSDAGIKQIADMEPVMPVEAADIVVRSVNNFDYGSIRQNFSESIGPLQSNRIDNVYFMTGSNLNQAELLGITKKVVGLGIEGNLPAAEHRLDSSVKLGGMGNDFDGKGRQDGHESQYTASLLFLTTKTVNNRCGRL